jgi:Na+/proline symporter
MLASKSERDSLGGTLFFNLAHYVFRPWPWIISALCSILIFPDLASIQAAFPHADPALIGHDSAYAAMMKFLPAGFFGLMIAGLIAATSSTILTHLNWGASYLVHDFYRRFMVKDGTEAHYVNAGRACTVLIYVFAATLSFYMTSAQQAFQVLLSIGAGTGMLYLARWFWWRVSAWCEVVAMVASLITAVGMKPFVVWLNTQFGTAISVDFATIIMLQVGVTTFSWIAVAFFGPSTDRATLISFVRKVKPAGPGWAGIREEAGVSDTETRDTNHTGLAFAGWISGVVVIWSGLFALGNLLYAVGDGSRVVHAWTSSAVFLVSGVVLLLVIKRLWAHSDGGDGAASAS